MNKRTTTAAAIIARIFSFILGSALLYAVYFYSTSPGIPADRMFSFIVRVVAVMFAVVFILAALRTNRHE